MNIKINNENIVTQAQTIAQLATELQLPPSGVAIAIGGKVVRRDDWNCTVVYEGQDILIIKAFAGG